MLVGDLESQDLPFHINAYRSLASPVNYSDISPMLFMIQGLRNDVNNINNNQVANSDTPPNPPTLASIYSITSLGI